MKNQHNDDDGGGGFSCLRYCSTKNPDSRSGSFALSFLLSLSLVSPLDSRNYPHKFKFPNVKANKTWICMHNVPLCSPMHVFTNSVLAWRNQPASQTTNLNLIVIFFVHFCVCWAFKWNKFTLKQFNCASIWMYKFKHHENGNSKPSEEEKKTRSKTFTNFYFVFLQSYELDFRDRIVGYIFNLLILNFGLFRLCFFHLSRNFTQKGEEMVQVYSPNAGSECSIVCKWEAMIIAHLFNFIEHN